MYTINSHNNQSFLHYLPSMRPSKEYIQFETSLATGKAEERKNQTITQVRQQFASRRLELSGGIQDINNCKLSTFNIKFDSRNIKNTEAITVHKISYNGSNIETGAIIEVHGGGYCVLGADIHFGFAEILSKLTGCFIFLLDYKLCPEYPLPYAVNELIVLYEYLLSSLHIPCTKIAMTGDSAGGGMILLALQSMKYGSNKYRNLPQPCCVWLNSPWTNLSNDNNSNLKNKETEVMMAHTRLNNMADWSVANRDAELNRIANNNKKNEIYSAQFGKFDGLSAMYFMVGQKEILLDHTLICAQKAFESGVNVTCDIHPFMCHVWPTFVNIFPESFVACCKACHWIAEQFKKCNCKQICCSKL